MGQGFLIDSNAIIDYLGNKLPHSGIRFLNDVVDDLPHVSVISKIEVLGYNAPTSAQKILEEFMTDVTIIDLSDEIIAETIRIRRNFKLKLPDAIIAASANVLRLPIITRNISDFKNITGLKLIDPWNI
ncbi:MAG: type II toxin-antitoxin system VapC family toxin [Bacteroidetes bacterium]|nr:type II toxin-antitoxin system VapC family toxin [Bacteroidota bacterium]